MCNSSAREKLSRERRCMLAGEALLTMMQRHAHVRSMQRIALIAMTSLASLVNNAANKDDNANTSDHKRLYDGGGRRRDGDGDDDGDSGSNNDPHFTLP